MDVPGCPGNHPSSNIALLTATTAAPVIPVDFSKPCFFRQLQLTKPQPYPFALLNTDTSTTLRVQYLSKPKQPYVLAPVPYQCIPSIAVLTSTQAQAAFICSDFSKPFFPSVATDKTQSTNVNLFTNPIPFYPADLSRSFFPDASVPVTFAYNPNLYQITSSAPFGRLWTAVFPANARRCHRAGQAWIRQVSALLHQEVWRLKPTKKQSDMAP